MPSGLLHEQILLRMNRGTSPGPEEGGGVGGGGRESTPYESLKETNRIKLYLTPRRFEEDYQSLPVNDLALVHETRETGRGRNCA